MEIPDISLSEQLDLYRQSRKRQQVRRALSWLVLGLSASLALLCGLDYTFQLPYSLRVVMAGLWYCYGIGFGIRVARLALQHLNDVEMAWVLEDRLPLREMLVSAVEFTQSRQLGTSVAMLDWTRLDAQVELSQYAPDALYPLPRRLPQIATAATLLFALCAWSFPSRIGRVADRILAPRPGAATAGPFSLAILSPGDSDIPEGEALQVRVQSTRTTAQPVTLMVAHNKTVTRRLMHQEASTGHYLAEIPNLAADLEYWAAAGNVRSRSYWAQMIPRPRVWLVRHRIVPPSYLNLPERSGSSRHGHLEALAGSTVFLEIEVSERLQSCQLLRGHETVRAILNGATARLQFVAEADETYRLEYAATNGHRGVFLGEIVVERDQAPRVRFESSLEQYCGPDDSIVIRWQGWDDKAIEKQQLTVTRNGQTATTATLPPTVTERTLILPSLGVENGDSIGVTVTVQDGAGQTGSTSRLALRATRTPHLRRVSKLRAALVEMRLELAIVAREAELLATSVSELHSMMLTVGDEAHHRQAALAARDGIQQGLLKNLNLLATLREDDLFPGCRAAHSAVSEALQDCYLFCLTATLRDQPEEELTQLTRTLNGAQSALQALQAQLQEHVQLWTLLTVGERVAETEDPDEARALLADVGLALPAGSAFRQLIDRRCRDLWHILSNPNALQEQVRSLQETYPPFTIRLASLLGQEGQANWRQLERVLSGLQSLRIPQADADATRWLIARVLENAIGQRRTGSLNLLVRVSETLLAGVDGKILAEAWARPHSATDEDQRYHLLLLRAAPMARHIVRNSPHTRRLSQKLEVAMARAGTSHQEAVDRAMQADLTQLNASTEEAQRRLSQYAEPVSSLLSSAAQAKTPDQRSQARLLLLEAVAELDQIARDQIRTSSGNVMIASDAMALSGAVTDMVQEASQPWRKADLEKLAKMALALERTISGTSSLAEAVRASDRLHTSVLTERPPLAALAGLRRERKVLDAHVMGEDVDHHALSSMASRLVSLLGHDGVDTLAALARNRLQRAREQAFSCVLAGNDVPQSKLAQLRLACLEAEAALAALHMPPRGLPALVAELEQQVGLQRAWLIQQLFDEIGDALQNELMPAQLPIACESQPLPLEPLQDALRRGAASDVQRLLATSPSIEADLAVYRLRASDHHALRARLEQIARELPLLAARQGAYGHFPPPLTIGTPGLPVVDLRRSTLERLSIALEAARNGDTISLQTALARGDWPRVAQLPLGSSATYLGIWRKIADLAMDDKPIDLLPALAEDEARVSDFPKLMTQIHSVMATPDPNWQQIQETLLRIEHTRLAAGAIQFPAWETAHQEEGESSLQNRINTLGDHLAVYWENFDWLPHMPRRLSRWEFLAYCTAEKLQRPDVAQMIRFGRNRGAIEALQSPAPDTRPRQNAHQLAIDLLRIPPNQLQPLPTALRNWFDRPDLPNDPVQQVLLWEIRNAVTQQRFQRVREFLIASQLLASQAFTSEPPDDDPGQPPARLSRLVEAIAKRVYLADTNELSADGLRWMAAELRHAGLDQTWLDEIALQFETRIEHIAPVRQFEWNPGCPWRPQDASYAGQQAVAEAILRLSMAARAHLQPAVFQELQIAPAREWTRQARDLLAIVEQRQVLTLLKQERATPQAELGREGIHSAFTSDRGPGTGSERTFQDFEQANSAALYPLYFRQANRRYLERLSQLEF